MRQRRWRLPPPEGRVALTVGSAGNGPLKISAKGEYSPMPKCKDVDIETLKEALRSSPTIAAAARKLNIPVRALHFRVKRLKANVLDECEWARAQLDDLKQTWRRLVLQPMPKTPEAEAKREQLFRLHAQRGKAVMDLIRATRQEMLSRKSRRAPRPDLVDPRDENDIAEEINPPGEGHKADRNWEDIAEEINPNCGEDHSEASGGQPVAN